MKLQLRRLLTWRLVRWWNRTAARRRLARDVARVTLARIRLALPGGRLQVAGIAIPRGRHLTRPILLHVLDGTYEREELGILQQVIAPDDVVLELGSGIGFLATYCALAIGSDRVFTYEANPALEPHIRLMFERNRVTPSLRMCMLGRDAGWAELNVHRNFWASSTLAAGGRTVRVPVQSFAGALEAIRPTVLVVDIEGGERELFRTVDRLAGVRKICMEVHPWIIGADGVQEVRDRLERDGFTRDPQLSSERVWFLARPPDRSDP